MGSVEGVLQCTLDTRARPQMGKPRTREEASIAGTGAATCPGGPRGEGHYVTCSSLGLKLKRRSTFSEV